MKWLAGLDREYLEDYEQKEKIEYEKFLKRLQDDRFDFEKDRFPPDERFIKLQKPVSDTTFRGTDWASLWAQVPFCGSLVLGISPVQRSIFEKYLFNASRIPEIIDFIRETGRLQIALQWKPTDFEGLDFLDPFFTELKPPMITGLPLISFGDIREIRLAHEVFSTLSSIQLKDFVRRVYDGFGFRGYEFLWESLSQVYVFLRLGHYTIVEDLDNLIVDDPAGAFMLLNVCWIFISEPVANLRFDSFTFSLENIRQSMLLPSVYQPKEVRFPCEIGKFLTKKLTYAPLGLDACKELMYHYDAYDLRKVQKSLNEGIVTNHPDIVNKSAEEFSEILDNIWNDKAIPRKIKGLQIGIPLSMAAIGSVAAGPIGTAGGFLAGLGYNVAEKFIDLGTEGLSERLAKLKTKSYQANIYDFKKKYKGKITHP